MAYPTSVSPIVTMVSYLYNHASWPRVGEASVADAIYLFGLNIQAGWTPGRGVLVLPDDPGDTEFDAVFDSRFLFWCYGNTAFEASQVYDKLFDILHLSADRSATVSGEVVHIGRSRKMMGAFYLQEPDTLWHRYVCSFDVEIDRWSQ